MPSRRSAAFALAFVVPAPSIGALAAFWLAPGPLGLAIYALGKLVLYGTPAVWSRWVDGESWSWSPPRQGGWGLGLASGVAIAAVILVGWAIHAAIGLDTAPFADVLARNGLDDPRRFLLSAFWLCTANAALEEYAFRWFITTRWEAIAPSRAALLSALSFTSHHVIVLLAFFPAATALLASAGVFIGGLLWSGLYRRCRSIWPGWASHAMADIAILAIGWRLAFPG